MRTTWDAVAACEPEVIVCAPCGYDLDGATKEAERLVLSHLLHPGLRELPDEDQARRIR